MNCTCPCKIQPPELLQQGKVKMCKCSCVLRSYIDELIRQNVFYNQVMDNMCPTSKTLISPAPVSSSQFITNSSPSSISSSLITSSILSPQLLQYSNQLTTSPSTQINTNSPLLSPSIQTNTIQQLPILNIPSPAPVSLKLSTPSPASSLTPSYVNLYTPSPVSF